MLQTSATGNDEVINPHEKLSTQKEAETGDSEGEDKRKAKVTRNIIFVTSESAPYSKTGGLGDVCGSLPIALAARGHRVMVVSPRYQNGTSSDKIFPGASKLECSIKVHCFGRVQEVSFFHEYRAGVDWVRNFSTYVTCYLSFSIKILYCIYKDELTVFIM